MPYEPTNWKSGDVVTSAKLNKIENAIGGLVVTATTEDDTTTLNKTWQEIYDAFSGGKPVVILRDIGETVPEADAVITVCEINGSYIVSINPDGIVLSYGAESASGYPAITGD